MLFFVGKIKFILSDLCPPEKIEILFKEIWRILSKGNS